MEPLNRLHRVQIELEALDDGTMPGLSEEIKVALSSLAQIPPANWALEVTKVKQNLCKFIAENLPSSSYTKRFHHCLETVGAPPPTIPYREKMGNLGRKVGLYISDRLFPK